MRELSPEDIAAWERLEDRAAEPNAYLSPSFVLPALQHLEPRARPLALVVEARAPVASELVGLGLFRPSSPTRRFPLPHLTGYVSCHSFLGGLLLDRDCAAEALETMIAAIRRSWRWHGFVLDTTWGDGTQHDLVRSWAERSHATLQQLDTVTRAVLRLPVDAESHLANLSGKLRSNIRRGMRRLEERGLVALRATPAHEVGEQVSDAFLSLEHLGWKGANGTSLRSNPSHERFFREVVRRFAARGRALFTHLEVGGQVIASTSNFVSGNAAFAFKVAHDPEYAALSPGVLCEVEFLRTADVMCPEIDFIDSGAVPGSFIDKIWTDRRTLQTICLAVSPLGRLALAAVGVARARRPRPSGGNRC